MVTQFSEEPRHRSGLNLYQDFPDLMSGERDVSELERRKQDVCIFDLPRTRASAFRVIYMLFCQMKILLCSEGGWWPRKTLNQTSRTTSTGLHSSARCCGSEQGKRDCVGVESQYQRNDSNQQCLIWYK